MFKKILPLILTALLFTGCSSSSSPSFTTTNNVKESATYEENTSKEDKVQSVDLDYDFSLETNKFDKDYENLLNVINKKGILVTNSSLDTYDSNNFFQVDIRVPREKTEEVEKEIKEIGKLVSLNKFMDDITNKKTETTINIEAKEKELEAYKRLYQEAQSIDEIMKIEEKIAQTESVLNNYKNDEKAINNDSKYTDMHINLREVVNYTNKTNNSPSILETIKTSGQRSLYLLKSFIVSLIAIIFSVWWAILIGVICIYFINKKKKGGKGQK